MLLSKAGESFKIDLDTIFSDEDGESLDYRIAGTQQGLVSAEIIDDHTLVITSVTSGLALTEVRVTAYDNMGASARADISCIVRPEGESISLLEGRVVSDKLTILTGSQPEKIKVRLVSSTGTVVYSSEGEYSAFNPMEINLKHLAPGVYTLIITDASGKESKYPIVKR